jgi:hypothetical protein
MTTKKNGKRFDHSGSTFDSFLEEEGIRDEVEAVAIKRRLINLEQDLAAAAKGPKIEIPIAEIRSKGLLAALRSHARRR